jgi:hypothetical protein
MTDMNIFTLGLMVALMVYTLAIIMLVGAIGKKGKGKTTITRLLFLLFLLSGCSGAPSSTPTPEKGGGHTSIEDVIENAAKKLPATVDPAVIDGKSITIISALFYFILGIMTLGIVVFLLYKMFLKLWFTTVQTTEGYIDTGEKDHLSIKTGGDGNKNKRNIKLKELKMTGRNGFLFKGEVIVDKPNLEKLVASTEDWDKIERLEEGLEFKVSFKKNIPFKCKVKSLDKTQTYLQMEEEDDGENAPIRDA